VTSVDISPSRTTSWYSLDGSTVLDRLSVDASTGLADDEVRSRLAASGPNRLADPPKRPKWRALLDQFRDALILILLGAAVVSAVVSQEAKTPIVIAVVVLLNAVLGYVQEQRAEKSLEALKKMLVARAKVRRNGRMEEIDTADVVPGDIVLVEAGDRIPADGRLLVATNLEIEEAALTGESVPSVKGVAVIDRGEVPLGDRKNLAFMNTTVTRGRAELVVTATGMDTELGRIAGLLRSTESERTPLQQQLDALGHKLAMLAGFVVVLVFAIGLIRGESFADLFLRAVALAVAAIPEGLPAVVAVTLALGTVAMAKQHAIVKKLAGVETLGCTSVICSDKTGTLTLNQMTAVSLWFQGRVHEVSGSGYSTQGAIGRKPGDDPLALDEALVPMALCADAEVRDGGIVGDPTEAALVVLAAKGGLDAPSVRAEHPRLAEVPFDSTNKFMATFHRMETPSGPVVRMFAKGAPDVLLARAASVLGSDDAAAHAENRRLGSQGLRVLAVAQRDLPESVFTEFVDDGGDVVDLVDQLQVVALAGIVDPARPEAKLAIAECRSAGIRVKMITGDHAATAAAIGSELGLDGAAVSGADLDAMTDDDLRARIDDIAVFARVAPEHKMRLVQALQAKGNVVAMTGDGVNDAPALKAADMGVAMGITGTEVTKEAATMVLADDNFATIVRAVRQGRTIYDNIVSFIRFQLGTTLGFSVAFLGASSFNIAGAKPFTALQILWVNLIMDGPPAMALGVDPTREDAMDKSPRPRGEQILTRSRLAKLLLVAAVMGVGTLAVLHLAPSEVAGTMGFTTFVAFQFFNILNARDDRRSVFRRSTLSNRTLWLSLLVVALLQVAAVHLGPLQSLFETSSLSAAEWLVCLSVSSSILWVEELRKLLVRAIRPGSTPRTLDVDRVAEPAGR